MSRKRKGTNLDRVSVYTVCGEQVNKKNKLASLISKAFEKY
jgi:hypothetical protein